MRVNAEIVSVVQVVELQTSSSSYAAQVRIDLPGAELITVPIDEGLAQSLLRAQAASLAEPVPFGGEEQFAAPPRGAAYVSGEPEPPAAPPRPRRAAPPVAMDAAGNPIRTGAAREPEDDAVYDEDGIREG